MKVICCYFKNLVQYCNIDNFDISFFFQNALIVYCSLFLML